mmetsp:Transcript_101344/g.262394  ORF Transcript_101344/g.262394 Transcript_101344/m.262394 type:complete len:358 (+) Transcript_101344:86-1159(+)
MGTNGIIAETSTDKKTDDMVEVQAVQEDKEKASIVAAIMGIPRAYCTVLRGTVHLFCQRRFRIHRLTGMLYLVQFVLAVLGEFFPVILERLPHLHVLMPITGCAQAVIATLTFSFLGKNANVQGYFTDKRTMSYDFVFENVFFSGCLAFQALYFYQTWIFRACPMLEALCVFFPYFTIRQLFPRTRLRDSISNDTEKSVANRRFMNLQTWTSKVFMCFGKHVSGFLCNYLIFLDLIPEHHHRTLRYQFILGGWGTTIAMFLHTLKFKGYLGPRAAVLAYTLVFPLFYCLYIALFDILLQQYTITALALGGLVVNFGPRPLQVVWQVGVYMYLRYLRELAKDLNFSQESTAAGNMSHA